MWNNLKNRLPKPSVFNSYLESFLARRTWVTGTALLLGFLLGAILIDPHPSSRPHPEKEALNVSSGPTATSQTERWTCSMHPQVQKKQAGSCPICGMDLIPVEGAQTRKGVELSMSEHAMRLAEISTALVERKMAEAQIRFNGTVNYDEARVAYVTARVAGRIDHMFINATGTTVRRGSPMVSLYSPELISAQEELIQTLQAGANESILAAARERLRLWGLTPKQVGQIEKSQKSQNHMTITSPATGIVITKHVSEGTYVKTGTRVYTIADLSQVWVEIEAYESDLLWVKEGQEVEFTTGAYAGETFSGKVSLVDPMVNPKTRTVKLRVNASNPGTRLKPGMFVRASIKSRISAHGPVNNDSKLEESDIPLVIPVTAPLLTGKRSIVYVRKPQVMPPTFEAREVTLGPRADQYYLVRGGLSEGEEVVTHGSFKIDSDLQIQGKPSMMNPEAHQMGSNHAH